MLRNWSAGISCVLICCVFAAPAAARFHIRLWTTDNGLPQNSVYAVQQSRDGYLWLTTWNGLVRFDGLRFTVFDRSTTNGAISNRLTALFESRDGNLWIGMEAGGLIRYRSGAFTTYREGLGNGDPVAIQSDPQGRLLILTKKGLVRQQGESFVAEAAPDGTPFLSRNAWLDTSGAVWRADETGLHRIESGKSVLSYVLPKGLGSSPVSFVHRCRHGDVWVAGREGNLYRWQNGTFILIARALPPRQVYAMHEDRAGNLWMATSGALLFLREGQLSTLTAADGLPGAPYYAVAEDREGSIWVGAANGLAQLREEMITTYSARDGLSSNNTYVIHEDRAGDVWVGSWTGLNRFRNGKFVPVHGSDRKPFGNVTALHQDREGALWISTHEQGIRRLPVGSGPVAGELPQQRAFSAYAIYQDRRGNVWFGGLAGLFRLRSGELTRYGRNEGLPHDTVRAILEDQEGALWVGTIAGLARFKDGQFTSYTERDGFSASYVRSLYEDADRSLWIGTYESGLYRYRDGKFTRYTKRDGLFDNGVFHILEDDSGNFWISCNRGIYRVSRRELNDFAEGRSSSITSVPYGKIDGLLSTECNGGTQPAGWKRRNGELWFPTQGGVAVIHPDRIQRNSQPPPLVIEDFVVDQRSVAPRDGIQVGSRAQNLEIHYSGLSFTKPDYVKFKYRLMGLDAGWVDAGARRVAYYSRLPAGTFTFNVIAANSDGVWNPQGASLRFVVFPPFWRTWWFVCLSAAALVSMALLAHRGRVRQLQRKHAEQEAFSHRLLASQETERKRIAAELHDGLGQNLLIIKNQALLGLKDAAAAQAAVERWNEISNTASQALEEVRGIAYDLRPVQLDRVGLTTALLAMLRKASSAARIPFSVSVDSLEGAFAKELEIHFYRIVQEAVNNILKHSQATSASVSVRREGGQVRLVVEDNGKGLVPEMAPADSPRGLGHAGMAERARILRGSCNIQSVAGKGTTIVVTVGTEDNRGESREDQKHER